MDHSTAAVLIASGSAVLGGAAALAVLFRMSRRSQVWAIRLSPLVAVVSVAAGVTAASLTMLLEPSQVLVMAVVLLVSIPIAVTFGVIAGRRVAGLQREAAEQSAARQRDREIEDRRRELITWLSHDLRTPLARMRALTEAQEDGLAPPDYTTRMLSEVDGLAVVVDDIATLSRLHGPSIHMNTQSIDLSDLVSDCVAGTQPLADRLGLTLEVEARGAVLASVDPAEMTRAVDNLIVNALRHTRPEGFVRVAVTGNDGQASIAVRDQCGGIPADHLERLFEAGWRGTTARTPGDSGVGLGLTIAHRIVAAHHGAIEVANTDDGCVFTIVLPAPTAASTGDGGGVPLEQATTRTDP